MSYRINYIIRNDYGKTMKNLRWVGISKKCFHEECVVFSPYIISWRLAAGGGRVHLKFANYPPPATREVFAKNALYLNNAPTLWSYFTNACAPSALRVKSLHEYFYINILLYTTLSNLLIHITVTFLLYVFLRTKQQTMPTCQQPQ